MPDNSNLTREIQPMPDDVREALASRNLTAAYDARPAYQRNDYLAWIARTRRPETRHKRLNQMLDELGPGAHDEAVAVDTEAAGRRVGDLAACGLLGDEGDHLLDRHPCGSSGAAEVVEAVEARQRDVPPVGVAGDEAHRRRTGAADDDGALALVAQPRGGVDDLDARGLGGVDRTGRFPGRRK